MVRVIERPTVFPACEQVRSTFDQAMRKATALVGANLWRVVHSWNALRRRPPSCVFIVFHVRKVDDSTWLGHLRRLSSQRKVLLGLLRGLPPEAIPERVARLGVRNPERIHFVRAGGVSEEEGLIERFLLAIGSEDSFGRIIDAWWEDDRFVAISPGFERLHVPVSKLRPLSGHSKKRLANFEIDEEGAFVYWPDLDVHLGWDQLAQAVDQKVYLKAHQQSEAFNKHYGRAVRALREQKGLRQSDISGLTSRQVGRIERGQCRATHSALSKLAKAHGMSASEFMGKVADLLERRWG